MKKRLISALLVVSLMLSVFTLAATTGSASNSVTPYSCGDVTGDGEIGITDVLEILMFLAGLDNMLTDNNYSMWAARVVAERQNPGEHPTISDVLEILMFLAGLENVVGPRDCTSCNWCLPGRGVPETGAATTSGNMQTPPVTTTIWSPPTTTTQGPGTTPSTTTTTIPTTTTTPPTTVSLEPGQPPQIATNSLHSGMAGQFYTVTLMASSPLAVTWSLAGGTTPPAGLTLNTATGVISGIPAAPGSTTFQVIATNANGSSAPRTLSLVVGFAPTTTTTTQGTGTEPTTTTTTTTQGTGTDAVTTTTTTTQGTGTNPIVTTTTTIGTTVSVQTTTTISGQTTTSSSPGVTSAPPVTTTTASTTTNPGDPPGTARVVYNMGDDASLTTISGHPVLSTRNGAADTTIAGTGASRTITLASRGGTSQGVDILLSSLNLRANHHYRFDITGRITTGAGPHTVFFNNVSDRTSSTPDVNANLVPNASVATNTNFTFTHTTDFATINSHAQSRPNAVYRIGGASQQTLVVSRLVITVFCPSGCTCAPLIAPRTFANLSATQLIADIGVGWNLGNFLDAHDRSRNHQVGYALTTSVSSLETSWASGWGNQAITPALITAVRNAGFNTIRIPVTWYKVADPANDYRIRAVWMTRVKEVVDMAYNQGMYVILNTHHEYAIYDGLTSNSSGALAGETAFNRSRAMVQSFWRQIGNEFSSYSERLIFEGLNEPRDFTDTQWYGYGRGEGNPVDPRTATLHGRINTLNQDFVTAVRNTGGNNAHRILMMPAYAASGFFWNSNGPLDNFRRPTDPSAANNGGINKFVLSVHRYEPKEFTLDGVLNDNSGRDFRQDSVVHEMVTTALAGISDRATRNSTNTGRDILMPVILGEWGTTNSPNYNTARRVAYAQHYVREATRLGMRTVVWDNGARHVGNESLGLFDRRSGQNRLFDGRSGDPFDARPIVEAIRRGRGLIT